ncbi:hypothetical protein ACWIG3_11230 [Streptomyces celluloflavus]|uniref:Sugar kinase n=2 Tax=Streptomyces TaxID=1883 RepID=A0A4Q9I1G2_STRKA|nr:MULTISPECIES: hypothetical protein [Streptomyces]MYU54421.1 hypothetical protein [Streptomyces sp. SID7805]TBO61483.1 hypothetical protein EYS09_00820 [Streptomyces kasugaensis]WSK16236.1 hypothetical protein OG717_33570 [Streptomyces celluloflavus]
MTEPDPHMHDDHLAGPPRGKRPRPWLMALIVFLLITIPAGYIVISAEQSRDSGEGKEQEAAATGLTNGFPSKVQQRIYNVPVPVGSTPVYYYESNSWQTSSLFVQFRTDDRGLDKFLTKVGTSAEDLNSGTPTIAPEQAAKVGWDFTTDRQWTGTSHEKKAPQPSQRIMVSHDEPGHPVVYTVSTITF